MVDLILSDPILPVVIGASISPLRPGSNPEPEPDCRIPHPLLTVNVIPSKQICE